MSILVKQDTVFRIKPSELYYETVYKMAEGLCKTKNQMKHVGACQPFLVTDLNT